MKSLRESAKKVLDMIQKRYQDPYLIEETNEEDFPHLDFNRYTAVEDILKTQGFKWLVDLDLVNLSKDQTSIFQRTLIRTFLSQDGQIIASTFQVRPYLSRLLKSLLRGILNWRWIDAPRFVFKKFKSRQYVDFTSEFSDGSFTITSNAHDASLLSEPPTIKSCYFPYKTSTQHLFEAHRSSLVAELNREKSIRYNPVRSKEEMFSMMSRLKAQKNVHRAAVGWLSQSELNNASPNHPELAKKYYQEIQDLLRQQEFGPDGAPDD